MKSPPNLILASTSRYRRDLLARLAIPFECQAPGVDETALPDEPAASLVVRLAHAKARAVASQRPDDWVIGSDQIAVLAAPPAPERVLGKPGTATACREQLLQCSGRTLSFVTAVALIRQCAGALHEFIDVTRVTYRTLDHTTIERYVEREAPLDCAGGFKSEGLGITLCERIESTDPTALIGLPLLRLSAALRTAGFELP